MENNNNNLFTNMFGVESEEKPEEQLPNTLNSLNTFKSCPFKFKKK